jgi:hypothetical protein
MSIARCSSLTGSSRVVRWLSRRQFCPERHEGACLQLLEDIGYYLLRLCFPSMLHNQVRKQLQCRIHSRWKVVDRISWTRRSLQERCITQRRRQVWKSRPRSRWRAKRRIANDVSDRSQCILFCACWSGRFFLRSLSAVPSRLKCQWAESCSIGAKRCQRHGVGVLCMDGE